MKWVQQMMQLGQELNDTLAELKALKEQPAVEQTKPYTIPQLKLDKGTGKIVEMDRMRSMIADHMVYSKHTSPHVTAYVEADMTNIVNWRNANKVKFQETYGDKLTFTPLFVEAVANAITEFPMINVSVDGKNIIVKEHINVGMATALPSGNLIVPVVKDADKKNLQELATDVNRMANLARENKLGGDDIKGSTFTISNVGTFGSVMGTPIINQPEAAILATGIIKKRPEVITKDGEDTIEIRSMMYLSLSFDHRIVDGFLGGSFLKKIADNLEPKSYTSREFIREIGKYLKTNSKKKNSLIETAYDNNVPIFCPAFTDSSAGFGLVMHQEKNPNNHITIDSVREFRELTEIKIKSKTSGLLMIGGGVPKNFIQDTVICAELLGKKVGMHKYAVQITVADTRDGACSSSTLKEASSWGKVNISKEQMVFAEATSVLPLIASDAYHRGHWKQRERKNFSQLFR